MVLSKIHIRLSVRDAVRSAAFYEALLGAAPASRDATTAVFELDSPPLVLTVEERVDAAAGAPADSLAPRPGAAQGADRGARRPRRAKTSSGRSRFALLLNEPRLIGNVAVALRRSGARLRLKDEGLEADDPDGNAWRVRLVAPTADRAVVGDRPS